MYLQSMAYKLSTTTNGFFFFLKNVERIRDQVKRGDREWLHDNGLAGKNEETKLNSFFINLLY